MDFTARTSSIGLYILGTYHINSKRVLHQSYKHCRSAKYTQKMSRKRIQREKDRSIRQVDEPTNFVRSHIVLQKSNGKLKI